MRSKVLDPLRNSKNIMQSRVPLKKTLFFFSFLKGNCDGWLQKKTIHCFLEFGLFLFSYEAAPESMVFFSFWSCDRGACGALGATAAVGGSLVELFISLWYNSLE